MKTDKLFNYRLVDGNVTIPISELNRIEDSFKKIKEGEAALEAKKIEFNATVEEHEKLMDQKCVFLKTECYGFDSIYGFRSDEYKAIGDSEINDIVNDMYKKKIEELKNDTENNLLNNIFSMNIFQLLKKRAEFRS